ncbi:uncharacterized protein HD556DRAFT_1245814, partial [Suillus plorans]
EGPSKGKGIDPQNWGSADLEESEVDPEAQREALATWARSRTWANEGSARQTDSDNEPADPVKAAIKATEQRMTERIAEESEIRHPVREMVEKAASQPSKKQGQRETPPTMDAAAQIAPKSYLGRAFEKITHKKRKESKPSRSQFPDDPSSSSSESSTSQSSSSESSSESSSSASDGEKRVSKKHRKSKKRKSKRKSTLRPIPPKEYDGAVDPRAFHRFITEGTAYVEDGNVPRGRRVFVLSYYLKGKAHDFYVRQVSDRPGDWKLKEFFTELFNYCFPLDFRTKQ